MSEPRIVLAGMGAKLALAGLTWESGKCLRIGRQTNLDVVLRDNSVERVHAEVRHQGMRWILRDLAHNPMYPTLVNDVSMTGKDHVLSLDDVVRVGRLQLAGCRCRRAGGTRSRPHPAARRVEWKRGCR